MSERLDRKIGLSFFEELQIMPFIERCIVLGIVMGVQEKEIQNSLRLEKLEYEIIVEKSKLKRWHLFRALLDN